MRGPSPKPFELRVLHGSAARQLAANAPKLRRKLPRCPDYLQGEAADCWKRTAKELYDAGLLTTVDRDALAAYCAAFARWREAEAVVEKRGMVVVTNVKKDEDGNVIGGGNYIQNPYLAIANKALELMCKLQAEFGMTPSSRTRVRVAPPNEVRPVKPREQREDDADDPREALTG